MNLAENFFTLEQLLVDRLTLELADLTPKVKILTAADLAGVSEEQQITPAIHLVYRGYRPTDVRTDGKAARLQQTWLAVVATRNARQLRSGEAARADAGQIAQRVLRALMGYQPTGSSKPLMLTDGPEAGFNGGFQYLPLAFTAELAISVK
jgi:hypothetical protein